MATDVSGLTVSEILDDLPADAGNVGASGGPITTAKVTRWKNESEARAALLLRGQGASTTLSDDAVLFAGDYVKQRVLSRILRTMGRHSVANEYRDEYLALEPVLESFAEQVDQDSVAGGRVNSNIDTTSPTKRRFGSDYDGF